MGILIFQTFPFQCQNPSYRGIGQKNPLEKLKLVNPQNVEARAETSAQHGMEACPPSRPALN